MPRHLAGRICGCSLQGIPHQNAELNNVAGFPRGRRRGITGEFDGPRRRLPSECRLRLAAVSRREALVALVGLHDENGQIGDAGWIH